VQALFCALNFGAAEVAPVDVIVTPDPAANVVRPTPIDATLICCPAVNTEGGIVTVTAEALDVVTNLFSASAATNVYVVPVCALKFR
jgi:hypothetical protein